LGRKMEQQAEAFYRKLAGRTRNVDVKRLCLILAEEEKDHKRVIEEKLHHWKPLPISQKILSILDTDARLRGLFLSPPNHDADTDEFIEYALDQEQRMVAFYMEFENEFSHAWKKKRLNEMIDAERRHVRVWSEILSPHIG